MDRYDRVLPTPPSSSPPHPSSPSVRRSSQPVRSQQPQAHCLLDEYLLTVEPRWKPHTKGQVQEFLRDALGATDANMAQYLGAYNQAMQQVIDMGGVRPIGRKPDASDPSIHHIPIPNSPYAVRVWDGGMNAYGQFCLDFFNVTRQTAVNLPAGYSVHSGMPPPYGSHPQLHAPGAPSAFAHGYGPLSVPIPMSGSLLAGELGSWERNLGMSDFPDGEEKWSVPEGSFIAVKRSGHPDFWFQVPVRPVHPSFNVAQMQRGPLC